MFEQCDYLYFDLGSNIGVQIRKLFEPEKYPGAAVLPIFDQFFGPAESRRGSVCAFGFEVNPKTRREIERDRSVLPSDGLEDGIPNEGGLDGG